MDIYAGTLFTLILANVGLASYRLNGSEGRINLRNIISNIHGLFSRRNESRPNDTGLVLTFLPVYVLVMASDWMQVG